ncbi:protease inhibitor I42 family protein [Plantactinospora sonchi]|uniref:Protease inhibitor I42 family protein n=1 Tax=Plantactinospora sonchi TaxID=1544735 RepID=A0ABU7S362_9ACTN
MARHDLTEKDTGRSFPAAPGDLVVVELGETPSSGYRWHLEAVDDHVVAPAGDAFRTDEGGLGAGGRRQLRFSVVGEGRTTLRLVLRRGWEPDGPVGRRFEVIFTVR